MSLKLFTQILAVVVSVSVKNVTIFHSSDFNGELNPILTRTGLHVGGFARLLYYLDENRDSFYIMAGNFIRQPHSRIPNRILIEGELLNKLQTSAISLGYNEFRLEIDNFLKYTQKFNSPIVSTNFPVQNSSVDIILPNNIVVMSYAVNNFKYEPLIFTSKNLKAEDMIDSLNKRIKFHTDNNISKSIIFIAIGCHGIDTAKYIAETVTGLNIVISGCSKVMQWNEGNPPENIKKDSKYPLVYENEDGKKVLIAHSYGTTRFLGKLTLNINSDNELQGYTGNMIYLSNSFPENNAYTGLIQKLNELEVARTRVYLNGECHKWECNLGNLITDAFVNYKVSTCQGDYFSDVAIGLMAAKNIKSSVNQEKIIFTEDLLHVIHPHRRLVIVEIEGSALKEVIEESLESGIPKGLFLQVSGLHIRYDRRNSESKRLVALLVRCNSCDVPFYSELNLNKMYNVITTIDMTDGTLGHFTFGNKSNIVHVENTTDFLAARTYINQMKYIKIGRMERIRIVKVSSGTCITKTKIDIIALLAVIVITSKHKP